MMFDTVFHILPLIVHRREQIEGMMTKWDSWLQPDGILCICSITMEDIDPEGKAEKYDNGGLCA